MCTKYHNGYRYLFVLIALLYIGCVSNNRQYAIPVFDKKSEIRFEKLTGEELYTIIRDIWVYKSYLLVYGFQNNYQLHIYDKTSGKKILETIAVGRGPKEMNGIDCMRLDSKNGIVTAYDYMQDKKLSFQVDSLVKNGFDAISEQKYVSPVWSRATVPLHRGELIVKNIGNKAQDTVGIVRLEIRNDTGSIVAQNDNFPFEAQDLRFNVYNESRVSVSPDETRLAIGTIWGGILETYSLDDGIEHINTGYFAKPDIITGEAPGFTEETVLGFSDIYATNDKVYTSFDGIQKAKEFMNIPSDRRPLQFNKIDIFDWQGHGIEEIVTDYNVLNLCVDTDKTIYAAIYDNDGRFYLGKITPGTDK